MTDAAVFQNATDEKNVLAAALAHEGCRARFIALLRPEDFTLDEGKVIAWGLHKAQGDSRKPDPRSFHTLVEECPFGRNFGGYQLLQALIASCPRPLDDMDALCARVRFIGTKDRVFQELTRAADVAADPSKDITDVRAVIEDSLRVLDSASVRESRGLRTPEEINKTYFQTLRERMAGKGFFPTGLQPLDDVLTEGFLPGRLTAVAARPSIGKSTFAVNLMHRTASLKIGSVAMFANEAPDTAIWDKLNSIATGIPLTRLIKQAHTLTTEEKQLLHEAMKRRASLPLEINDHKTFSLTEMEETIALRHRQGKKFDVVFVDLFTRAEEFRDSNTRDGHSPTIIHDSLVRLQQIAQRYEFHCVIFIQMGRYDAEGKAEGRSGKGRMVRPTENKIYGADAYQQVCDSIFVLHRCHHYNPVQYPEDIFELWIRKQRYGEVTMVCLDFDKDTARITPTNRFPTDFSDAEKAKYAYRTEAPAFRR